MVAVSSHGSVQKTAKNQQLEKGYGCSNTRASFGTVLLCQILPFQILPAPNPQYAMQMHDRNRKLVRPAHNLTSSDIILYLHIIMLYHIYVQICTFMYMYIYVPLCICTYMYLYVYVHICTFMYMYIYVHICTYMYIYVYI